MPVKIVFGLEFDWRYLIFVVEVLAAEALFLYSFDKKRFFPFRYALVTLALMMYRILYVNWNDWIVNGLSSIMGSAWGASLNNLLLYLSIIALSTVLMLFCFKGRPGSIVAACTAGYAVQHFAFKLYDLFRTVVPVHSWTDDLMVSWLLFESLIHCVVYIAAYFIFARPAAKENFKGRNDPMLNILSLVIVLISVGVNRFAADFGMQEKTQIIANCLYAMTCCVFALIIQFALFRRSIRQTELEMSMALITEQARQYEQWKASFDEVNMKFHDLRHELNVLKDAAQHGIPSAGLSKIENMIINYSSVVYTGNEVLDVLLTNKKMLCDRDGIIFTCIADGTNFKNANGAELFSLFCNALDNAIESVRKIDDADKRVISLVIRCIGDLVEVHLQNYFEGDLEFSNGLPVTDKAEPGHGYGMRSMKQIVERFGGAISAYSEGELFNLQLLIPTNMT